MLIIIIAPACFLRQSLSDDAALHHWLIITEAPPSCADEVRRLCQTGEMMDNQLRKIKLHDRLRIIIHVRSQLAEPSTERYFILRKNSASAHSGLQLQEALG